MKSDVMISIVVPNYNNVEYLNECVDSLVRQSFKNIEILILDDKSNDNSREVIEKLAQRDSRIVPVYNEKNLGISVNRHSGIMMAKGKYITTLDSDDYLTSEKKLEKEYEIMEKRAMNEVVAFSKFILVDGGGSIIRKQAVQLIKEGNILSCILTRTCMIPRDYMFTKKQYTDSGGFDPKVCIYEDWDLKIRMSNRYKFCYTGIEGIAYRRHGQGLSALKSPFHYKWLSYIYRKNKRELKNNISNSTEKQFYAYLEKNFSLRDKILSYLLWG